jgi:hypothetical protein
MTPYLGDISASATIHHGWTSDVNGVPSTLSSGAVRVYKNSTDTESSAGITFTPDFDTRTGLNHLAIDTSVDGAFYAAGANFLVVLTAGSVDGQTVTPRAICSFSIGNRSNAAIATTLATVATYIDTEVAAIKAKTDQLVFTTANQVDARVASMAANTMTAAAAAADLATEIAAGIDVDEAAIATAVTAALAGNTVSIVSVVAENGDISEIRIGDSYSSTGDTRTIDFTYSGLVSITGLTPKLSIKDDASSSGWTQWNGTVSGSSSPWTVRFSPTAAETALLSPGYFEHDVEVRSTGEKATIFEGRVTIIGN